MSRTAIKLGGAAALLVGMAACAHLLGLGDRETRFPHRAHVLEGISCVSCHVNMEGAGDTGALHLPDQQRCVDCHKEPHDDRTCLECHGSATTRMRASENRKHLRFAHSTHLERTSGQCVRCHSGIARGKDTLTPAMAVCFTCHPHEDQFTIRDCGGCHVDLSTEGSMPSEHFIHDMDFGRRHGVQAASGQDMCATCHKERFCAQCHGVTVATLPARADFDDPMGSKLHRAGFMARHSHEAQTQGGLCGRCHDTEQFCGACHQDRGVGASNPASHNPHPSNWLGQHGRAARRDPVRCAACHGGGGEQLCVGCHSVGAAGGSVHPPGWSSRKRMSELPCRRCHIP